MKSLAIIFSSLAIMTTSYAQNTFVNGPISLTGNTNVVWNAASFYSIDSSGHAYAFGSRSGNFSISDETAGAWRFVINSVGSVGIGTWAPAANLQVGDNFNGIPGNTKLFINSGGVDRFGRLVISPDGNGAVGAVISGYFDNPTYTQKLILGTIGYSGVEQTMILQNGNVGIGSGIPRFKFSVNLSPDNNFFLRNQSDWGGGRTNGVAVDARNDTENASVPLLLRASKFEFYEGNVGIGTNSPGALLGIAGNSVDFFRFDYAPAPAAYNLKLTQVVDTGDVHWNFIQRNGNVDYEVLAFRRGNVGIGTTSPTEKLSVNGKIRAKEVIVETTGWSDHVFADSYQLQSLSEVEQHIKTDKHLPGVPSAQEVAANGVSVGDMQAILLAKIEELTLHQIAQEKRLASQDTKLAEATAKIEAQQVEIARLKTAAP